ncbi:hypothetical protein Q8F55_001628 [Vanrija albida]|uniref:Uncharacterized protein n=1 Tax=Vanrija albida TaxID=181172 RepID=A0ABR3QGL3_9TREE
MATLAAYYSALPTVDQAHESLSRVQFDAIKSKVGKLLLPYGDAFGMCLVHHHFDLFEGEVMAEGKDGVCKPHLKSSGETFYPKRYDRNGKAYEFSTLAQEGIPDMLFEAFRAIVPEEAHLGLYSRQGDDEDADVVEVTSGGDKERVHRLVPRAPEHDNEIIMTTSWFVAKTDPTASDGNLKAGMPCWLHNNGIGHSADSKEVSMKSGASCGFHHIGGGVENAESQEVDMQAGAHCIFHHIGDCNKVETEVVMMKAGASCWFHHIGGGNNADSNEVTMQSGASCVFHHIGGGNNADNKEVVMKSAALCLPVLHEL